jgi:hypothetical protein
MCGVARSLVFSPFLLAVCLAPGTAHADPERPQRDTLNAKLFPLAVGHKWAYAFGEKEVTFEVLRTEKLDDVTLYVVRRTIDKAQVDFKVAAEEDGVYTHQEGKKEFHPPLRQFAFFARTGDEWKWKGTAGGKLENQRFEHLGVQKVTAPAGTFSAVCVYQNNPESGEHATFWLVKDIGVVKVSGKTEVLTDAPDKGPVLFEWALKKFEPRGK